MIELNKIYQGDCSKIMEHISDNYVDLTITSPPYDNLREYNGFSFDFKKIVRELFRITKKGGVVVWIVGDAVINKSESGTSFRQALYFIECGFKLHDTMIYERTPSFPSSKERSNRYSQAFEYMFVFSKDVPKTVNLISDKKNRWAGCSSFGTQTERLKDGTRKIRGKTIVKEYGVRLNIWKYAKGKGFSSKDDIWEHPATFPEKLAEDHILSWSNEGDVVLDIMCGSGTTLKMAYLNKRKFLGIEISEEYCKMARQRIKTTQFD